MLGRGIAAQVIVAEKGMKAAGSGVVIDLGNALFCLNEIQSFHV
jgi:hypothetical protein